MDINILIGKTLHKIEGLEKGSDEIKLFTQDRVYKFLHDQDCCESVLVEDFTGDVEWLLNSPILGATESTSDDDPKFDPGDSWTWTFYRISTIKGTVTIRWYGESNGFYSEDVSLIEESV